MHDAMGLLVLLLLPLAGVSGLPFYNGFYYSSSPVGNGHGEGGPPFGPSLGSTCRVTETSPGPCCDPAALFPLGTLH